MLRDRRRPDALRPELHGLRGPHERHGDVQPGRLRNDVQHGLQRLQRRGERVPVQYAVGRDALRTVVYDLPGDVCLLGWLVPVPNRQGGLRLRLHEPVDGLEQLRDVRERLSGHRAALQERQLPVRNAEMRHVDVPLRQLVLQRRRAPGLLLTASPRF